MGTGKSAKELSDLIVRLVQVLFGVILAQGILRNSELIVSPFSSQNIVAVLGFGSLYFTTVRSWIDWHITMSKYPYDIRTDSPHSTTEMLRLWTDIGFVVTYAYLLFTVENVIGKPGANLLPHLQGYAALFALYWVSGALRRRNYGISAGQLRAIGTFGSLYGILLFTYWQILEQSSVASEPVMAWINSGALAVIFLVTAAYRSHRQKLRKTGADPDTVSMIDNSVAESASSNT